ncbi:MAG: hypothetical protein KJ804_19795 [Proteobacteria bacterium]|nr:hypothetical protein [Pseudomonadota bacterium]
MDKSIAKLLLDNLAARIVVDPETGRGTLEGVLTSMEMEALKTASDHLVQTVSADIQSISPKPVPDPQSEPGAEGKSEVMPEAVPDVEPETETEKESVPEQEDDIEAEAGAGSELDSELEPEEKQEVEPDPDPEVAPKPEPEIKLNLASLKFDTPQNPNIKMCLDFGTAMSKAFASDIEGDEIVEGLKLKLGHRASGGTSKDIYPIPSSLWIGDNEKIYLGEEAIARSLHSDPSGNRQRFDSLKRELTWGMKESSPFQQNMNEMLNPTSVPLSNGDAITLYLGYLTDLACSEMEEEYNCSRYVVRNFGLPSWSPERRVWGEELLRTMLVKAQIVADTFHGKWDNGVSIHAVRSVLKEIDSLDELPEYLVAKGITEPLAVGSGRFNQGEPFKGLVMVVDVGAGTSDMALFVVAQSPKNKRLNAFPVEGCNQSLLQAGDTLDKAMQQAILKKAEIQSHDNEYPYIIQHLRMQLRTLKEDLFRDGYCNVNLVNGSRVRIELDEFLRQGSVKAFEEKLAEKFEDVLKVVGTGIAKRFGPDGLSVVLTGGGATLPMVKKLASGTFSIHNVQIKKYEVPLVPEDFESDIELATVYPQLAVALGGTMPFLIDEKYPIGDDFKIVEGKFKVNGGNPFT